MNVFMISLLNLNYFFVNYYFEKLNVKKFQCIDFKFNTKIKILHKYLTTKMISLFQIISKTNDFITFIFFNTHST